MLRTRLLTATAALALFAAPAVFAQDAMAPAPQDPASTPAPTTPAPTAPAPTDPSMPQAPIAAPAAPVAPAAATPATPDAATPVAANTVVDVLRSNGQFTTLLGAIEAAQLTETLSSQPAISIFAPTDAAFAALPEADRTRLMDPANVNELRQLLLYHVVVADVNSSQIQGAKGGVATANNAQVQLDGTGDALKIDAATVVQADIDASNGAIFAIDQVLNPATSQASMGDEEAAPAADVTEDAPATEAAPPADDAMTDDTGTDETVTEDTATPPAGEDTMTPPAATTTAPAPAPAGATAPTGAPAATTTTTASPPVDNPTDGQVDGTDDADTPAPTPTPEA